MGTIFVNSDAWNFWVDNDLEGLSRDGVIDAIRRDVAFYASRGGVGAILYNMNFQRSFYPTKVGTPFWKDLSFAEDGSLLLRGEPLSDKWREGNGGDGGFSRMFRASRHVWDVAPDFMALRYAICHEAGVGMWHSMRMDDIHHSYLGCEWLPQHADIWLDRKDLVRAWYRHTWRGEWRDNALDYGKREVFDYHVAMMREYVLDYESDGIELDWMRSVPVFAPGFDEANAPILTQFMRETRRACAEAEAKWGHPLRVGVRVPASAHEAFVMGMDVAAWAREGLVDLVVPSCRDTMTEQDCDMPIWRALCPSPIIIAPDLDYAVSSDHLARFVLGFDAGIDAGFASGWYHDGADTMYAYNHFPRHALEDHQGFPDEFAWLGDRDEVARRPRRHVFTGHRPCGEGTCFHSPYPDFVWSKCCNGGVRINCGEMTAGRKAHVVVGTCAPAALDILVNTVPCSPLPPDTPLPTRLPKAKYGDEPHWLQAKIPSGVLHDGWNNIEFFNRGDKDLSAADFAWLEVDVGQA